MKTATGLLTIILPIVAVWLGIHWQRIGWSTPDVTVQLEHASPMVGTLSETWDGTVLLTTTDGIQHDISKFTILTLTAPNSSHPVLPWRLLVPLLLALALIAFMRWPQAFRIHRQDTQALV